MRRLPALLLLGLQLVGDQVGEQAEDGEGLIVEIGGLRIERAEGAEIAAVSPPERDRQIALDPVLRQPRVLAEARIDAGVIDAERCDRTADDASIGGVERQLVAGVQAKSGVVEDGARGPRRIGDAGDERDAHPGRAS